jgi:hypothetical protein
MRFTGDNRLPDLLFQAGPKKVLQWANGCGFFPDSPTARSSASQDLLPQLESPSLDIVSSPSSEKLSTGGFERVDERSSSSSPNSEQEVSSVDNKFETFYITSRIGYRDRGETS